MVGGGGRRKGWGTETRVLVQQATYDNLIQVLHNLLAGNNAEVGISIACQHIR